VVTDTRQTRPPSPGLAEEATVYFNGRLQPLRDATINVATHGLNYGTGCFEGIRAYWSPEDEQLYVLKLREHVDRFFRSCAVLRIDLPLSPAQLSEVILAVARENGYRSDIYIRPIAFKSSPTIKLTLSALDDSLAVFAFPFGHYAHREGGLRVCLSAWRRIDDTAIPTRAKVAGSYVNAALASDDAHLTGYDEALMLSSNGTLSEASSANVFLVRGGELITPPLSDNILEGITREAVIELARRELGLRVRERSVGRTEVYLADEVFLTGTGIQIEPVTSVDHQPVGSGQPGPVTTRLAAIYGAAVRRMIPAYASWCTPVYDQREFTGAH
jgi:branched-chain amino acid aminotransferase